MANDSTPPGWSYNPSSWPHRFLVLTLALLGCGIATYLALYQVGVIANVWEPFFGTGSKLLLKESPIAQMLPIPDAALGAFAYLLEALADSIGGRERWRTRPWAVLLLGLIAGGLATAAIVLVLCQPLFFGTFCTLCLASAACSLLGAGAAAGEVLACLGHVKHVMSQGTSFWQALAAANE